MEINILKNEKQYMEVEIDNLTIAELLRNQLWKVPSVDVAAWKREHPTKNPVLILRVKEGTAKKALQECIEKTLKINDNILEKVKSAK
ncbi:MAG: RpoL/Rpb11 RNA polymerase subunit family protein [archaeon]